MSRGEPSPSNMGRCDICGKTVDLEHADDEMVIAAGEDFGNEEEGISADEAIDAIVRALDRSDNVKDDMLADALREEQSYRVHQRCLDETTLVFGEPGVEQE